MAEGGHVPFNCAREIAPGMIEATIEALIGSGFAGRLRADERLGEPGYSKGYPSAPIPESELPIRHRGTRDADLLGCVILLHLRIDAGVPNPVADPLFCFWGQAQAALSCPCLASSQVVLARFHQICCFVA
jgi:hypothetical protein